MLICPSCWWELEDIDADVQRLQAHIQQLKQDLRDVLRMSASIIEAAGGTVFVKDTLLRVDYEVSRIEDVAHMGTEFRVRRTAPGAERDAGGR